MVVNLLLNLPKLNYKIKICAGFKIKPYFCPTSQCFT